MIRRRLGEIVFSLGVLLMLGATLAGKYLVGPVKQLGPMVYVEQAGSAGKWLFSLFAFGFDLGLILLFLGSLYMAGGRKWRLLWLTAAGLAALFLLPGIPALLGASHMPWFFGIGGSILLVLAVFTGWFWGRERSLLDEPFRPAADLKMTGYLFLFLATWNICGLGGIPFFTLYPDKMMVFQTLPAAIGHTKLIMIYLILGWLFVGLGYYKTYRTGKKQSS